jgi:hypothetical protein
MTQAQEQTVEKSPKTSKKEEPKNIFDNLPEGEWFDFRLNFDGEVVEGHWINRRKAQPTSDGYKFKMKTDRGLYFIQNTDYGWIQSEALKDQHGNVYDFVTQNKQGFDFGKEPYGTVDAALKDAVAWLNAKEKERNNGVQR